MRATLLLIKSSYILTITHMYLPDLGNWMGYIETSWNWMLSGKRIQLLCSKNKLHSLQKASLALWVVYSTSGLEWASSLSLNYVNLWSIAALVAREIIKYILHLRKWLDALRLVINYCLWCTLKIAPHFYMLLFISDRAWTHEYQARWHGKLDIYLLTLIQAWISSQIPSTMCEEIAYPFLNSNGAAVMGNG